MTGPTLRPTFSTQPPVESTRRSVRAPVNLPTTLRSGDLTLEGLSLDLSTGGMSLIVERLLSPGQHLQIEIKVPQGLILAEGEVVHSGRLARMALGIRFSNLPFESLSVIHSVVAAALAPVEH